MDANYTTILMYVRAFNIFWHFKACGHQEKTQV
jgi:hypothetical protein